MYKKTQCFASIICFLCYNVSTMRHTTIQYLVKRGEGVKLDHHFWSNVVCYFKKKKYFLSTGVNCSNCSLCWKNVGSRFEWSKFFRVSKYLKSKNGKYIQIRTNTGPAVKNSRGSTNYVGSIRRETNKTKLLKFTCTNCWFAENVGL
jgi:hypothetical protein